MSFFLATAHVLTLAAKKRVFRFAPNLSVRLAVLASPDRRCEFELMQSIVSPDHMAIDVGASWGLYTQLLRSCAKRVIAFEPNPQKTTFLRSVFGADVPIHAIALSDRSGETDLIIPHLSSALATIETINPLSMEAENVTCVRVAVRRLDEMGLNDVGFIKIDVEGHELAVIVGARSLLLRDKPILFIEIERRHNSDAYAQVFSVLQEMGYSVFYRDGRKFFDFRHFDWKRDQPIEHVQGTKIFGRYIFNFLFLPKAKAEILLASLHKAKFEIIG